MTSISFLILSFGSVWTTSVGSNTHAYWVCRNFSAIFWMFFFSKGIMVKGTVLRGVAVMEDKDEILFDPWLELKLVFSLIDSELEPNDFDSAELNVFLHKNKALFLLVMKDGASWLKKEAQDAGAIGNMRFFCFIILHFDAMNAIGFFFVTRKTMLCYWWHQRSNWIFHCAHPSMYYWYGVLRDCHLSVFFGRRNGKHNVPIWVPT